MRGLGSCRENRIPFLIVEIVSKRMGNNKKLGQDKVTLFLDGECLVGSSLILNGRSNTSNLFNFKLLQYYVKSSQSQIKTKIISR